MKQLMIHLKTAHVFDEAKYNTNMNSFIQNAFIIQNATTKNEGAKKCLPFPIFNRGDVLLLKEYHFHFVYVSVVSTVTLSRV